MKNFILLASLLIMSSNLLANDLRQEKKNLIEAIKTNYNSWQVEQSSTELYDFSDSSVLEESVLKASQENYQATAKSTQHIFSDFNFKISASQAVVQFQVDFQKISAFMEKKDGQWQLVCAAVIPPTL